MENLLRKNNIIFHEKERKIKSIIKELSNHKCIDCNKQNPEYISLIFYLYVKLVSENIKNSLYRFQIF